MFWSFAIVFAKIWKSMARHLFDPGGNLLDPGQESRECLSLNVALDDGFQNSSKGHGSAKKHCGFLLSIDKELKWIGNPDLRARAPTTKRGEVAPHLRARARASERGKGAPDLRASSAGRLSSLDQVLCAISRRQIFDPGGLPGSTYSEPAIIGY